MNDRVFVNFVVKECLPFGVTKLSEIKREEVPALLKRIEEGAMRDAPLKLQVFFGNIIGKHSSCDEKYIMQHLTSLRNDVSALKRKLSDFVEFPDAQEKEHVDGGMEETQNQKESGSPEDIGDSGSGERRQDAADGE